MNLQELSAVSEDCINNQFVVEAVALNDSYDSYGTRKTKKVYNKYSHQGSQGQVKARLSEEKYKGILVQYDAQSVKCVACEAVLHPSTTSIHRHVITPKHIKNMALKKSEQEPVNAIPRYNFDELYYQDYRDPNSKCAIVLTSFFHPSVNTYC